MKTRQVVCLALILVLNLIVFVNAETVVVTPAPFNLASWIQHTFHTEKFSVVGDAQSCGDGSGGATLTFGVLKGGTFSGSASSYCPTSQHGMWLVFSGVGGWNPFREWKDNIDINCGSGNPQCNVELYCCPKPEPSSTDNCKSWVGPYSELKTATCTSWTNFDTSSIPKYKCTTIYGTEGDIPYVSSSFKYCSDNNGFDCYYYSGSGTTCTKKSYPSSYTSCSSVYSYAGARLYSLKSTCESNIQTCTPSCSGKECGSNGCWGSCGTCSSGFDCSNGQCIVSGITPPSTPTLTTCTGNQINCAGTCKAPADCCVANGGTKDCSDSTTDLNDVIQVVKLEIPQTPTASEIGDYRSPNYRVDSERTFKATLKNLDSVEHQIRIEAGFYSENYAENEAGLFASLFPVSSFFSIVEKLNCVRTEPFVKSILMTLPPGETDTSVIKISPLTAYVTLPENTYELKSTKIIPFIVVVRHSGQITLPNGEKWDSSCCAKKVGGGCVEGTGGWFEPKSTGVLYGDYYSPDLAQIKDAEIWCGNKQYGSVTYSLFGRDTITISEDYKKCIGDAFILRDINGTVNKTATQDYKDSSGSLNYKEIKKESLTKEKINTATNTELFASSCLKDEECLPKVNYTTGCVPIRSLRDDGTLTESKSNSYFEEAKSLLGRGIVGATIGGGVGILLCGGTIAIASTVAVPTAGLSLTAPAAICSALIPASALVGAGTTISFTGINQEDELIKELNAKNDNAVGICTAEPTNAFDLGGILTSIGKSVRITGNQTWDGIIIIIGGVFILFIFVKMFTK